MSVLIKGMEMPMNCLVCYCTDTEYGECVLDPEKRCPEDYGQRAEWCPLVPVPPHGRLIDSDALMETFRERKRPTLSDGEDGSKERVRYIDFISTLQAIKDAPTIIPAEEGE